MKVGSWLDLCVPQENWTELNLISKKVIDLLNDLTPKCVANLKENNNLVALTIDPMSSDTLVLHHLTEIGGGLLNSKKHMVALNGFGPLATTVRFKSAEDLFTFVIDVPVPSDQDISSFDTATEFNKLTKEKDDKTVERFRNIIILPPFIASVILTIPTSSPQEWAALIKAAAGNMKSELEDHDSFDEDEFDSAVTCVLRWLWCVVNDALVPPVLGISNDNTTSIWSKNLHDTFIRDPSDTSPDASQVQGPSNEVLNSLSLNVNQMALNREKQMTASKESATKKCKFDSLEPFIKNMILNASSASGSVSAVEPSAHVRSIMNCATISRAQLSVNHLLQKQNVHVEVPLPFITALMNGDWVCRNSSNPSKISFLLLGGSVSETKHSASEKANLTLQLQEVYNNQLSSDSISQLITCKYASAKNYMELLRLTKAARSMVELMTDKVGLFKIQMDHVVLHLEKEYLKYEHHFKQDPLFGMKFVCTLDCRFQSFLQKCMDNDSIDDVRPTFYDLQDILDDIERNKFTGFLPATLLSEHKKSPATDTSSNNSSNKQKAAENSKVRPEWRLPDGQKVGDIFDAEAIKSCPELKPGVKCCIRCASKGHCFQNCKNKASHCEWPEDVVKKYHDWQALHRKL